MSKTLTYVRKTLHGLLLALGILFFVMLVLALTPAPFYMHHALGHDPAPQGDGAFEPEHIVLFGGAGMPSEGNLIRLYYTASAAQHYGAPVLIVHPEDAVCRAEMTRYLVQSGLPEDRLSFMDRGSNTRSQALELAKADPRLTKVRLLVVTAPEQVRRTVKTLEKAGFTQVHGLAAREATVDFDLSLKGKELHGNQAVPTLESTNLRYTFWNYLKLEITCFREYFALAYYRLKGWI